MDALTTAVVPANVIRQVFTEALERLEATWDQTISSSAYTPPKQPELRAANVAARAASIASWSKQPDKDAEATEAEGERWTQGVFNDIHQKCIEAVLAKRAYYTLMLYTIETNAVVHMTQEQIQRMQQVDAKNKAARKAGVRDGE